MVEVGGPGLGVIVCSAGAERTARGQAGDRRARWTRIVALLGVWVAGTWLQAASALEPATPSVAQPMVLPADRLMVPLEIREGSSFGEVMEPWSVSANTLRDAALSVYDLATIHPGSELSLEFTDGEELPTGLHYRVDEDHTLLMARDGDVWSARMDEVAYVAHETTMTLTVTSSLWQAGMDAGLRPSDLDVLAKIFEYELDFNSELQPNAQLGLVGEVLSSPGHKDKLGPLHAVRLLNGGDVYEMIRFVKPDGKEGWYHKDGTAAKRPFLRSPLEFSRVTSGFNTQRFHPILKVRRPHNGTDFGAPVGTPVRAVADGVVDFAGPNGGHGNFVKLRHASGYDTSYSHMSAVLVRKGATVRQGQLIGRVGTSGLSTGPHMHYQMWKNGRFVDAMREVMPNVEPLEPALLPAFLAQVDAWLPKVPVTPPAGK